MTLTAGVTTVGTTATLIDGVAWHNPVLVHLHNNDNTDAVYVGGSDVTISTGLKLLKEDSIELTLVPANQLWAVSTKAGHQLSWIRQPL